MSNTSRRSLQQRAMPRSPPLSGQHTGPFYGSEKPVSSSITLKAAEWRAIALALQQDGLSDLAIKIRRKADRAGATTRITIEFDEQSSDLVLDYVVTLDQRNGNAAMEKINGSYTASQ
jgi:hypothetical protein